ncbi:MAG: sigma-70 family RNA polymerase sigma factor, partial [Kangiellaceae bacterium]|nr:sigma-70 family RNA polymerase sigma factor [Kangiellaceae bacterium]
QQLVEIYSRKLYVAAYRILNDQGLAEDCVQEVFVKIYRKVGSFDERSKFSTWLYSVTVNTAIDMQRKVAKHVNSHTEEAPDFDQMSAEQHRTPESELWNRNISEQTQRALMQLGEDVRIAFLLRHHEERSIEEISQILDLNPNTVKNRIFRAVSRLREILEPRLNECKVSSYE